MASPKKNIHIIGESHNKPDETRQFLIDIRKLYPKGTKFHVFMEANFHYFDLFDIMKAEITDLDRYSLETKLFNLFHVYRTNVDYSKIKQVAHLYNIVLPEVKGNIGSTVKASLEPIGSEIRRTITQLFDNGKISASERDMLVVQTPDSDSEDRKALNKYLVNLRDRFYASEINDYYAHNIAKNEQYIVIVGALHLFNLPFYLYKSGNFNIYPLYTKNLEIRNIAIKILKDEGWSNSDEEAEAAAAAAAAEANSAMKELLAEENKLSTKGKGSKKGKPAGGAGVSRLSRRTRRTRRTRRY